MNYKTANKENIILDTKKNRSRGDNWTQEEKDLFMEIMKESAPIIENKHTDTNSNKKKNLEWLKIQNKLKELTGKFRDMTQLKGFWRRTKLSAKSSVSQHRRALQATGGGPRPLSPPASDIQIMELCPTDFVVEENIYDSDATSQSREQQNHSIIIDMDDEVFNDTAYESSIILENINDEEKDLTLNKTITIADVCDNETNIKTTGGSLSEKIHHTSQSKIQRKQKNIANKADLCGTNIKLKIQAMEYMEEEHKLKVQAMEYIEEEHKLKIKYHKLELSHQELRHKLEIDLLMLEKEKKLLEIKALKKTD